MTPAFMRALKPLVQWIRSDPDGHGWERGSWDSARNAKWSVCVESGGDVEVFRRGAGGVMVARFCPETPQQAVDVLCALWVLPPRFSSAYLAGRVDEAYRRRHFELRA